MTSILTVCTGNVCRSPATELLLKEYLPNIGPVSSAGVRALDGSPIPGPMLAQLGNAGIDGRGHRAQQFTALMASQATLVIAMSAAHRTAIVQLAPSALRTTFLFDELVHAARLSGPLAGASPRERITNLPNAMTLVRPELAGLPITDVPDPFGKSTQAYRDVFTLIEAGAREVSAWVTQ